MRGGILDVYSPEAERPVRIEFFGDEVESIRKFDPATQRSSNPVDEALLLPLTETPVSEELLGAVHARLSGKRITGNEEIIEQAVRSGGVTVFPGWEFYAPVAGANHTVFDLLPRALVLTDEPEAAEDRVRSRLVAHRAGAREQRRGQPGAAADLYLPPEDWWQKLARLARGRCRASRHRAQRRFRGGDFISHPAHAPLPRLGSRHARGSEEADRGRASAS